MTAPDVDAMLTEEGPAAVQAELDRLREDVEAAHKVRDECKNRLEVAERMKPDDYQEQIQRFARERDDETWRANVAENERDMERAEHAKFRAAVMAWRARRDDPTRVRFDLDMRAQGVTIE